MNRAIFREERLQSIFGRIEKDKRVYVKRLAKEFDVSDSSIRLDLAELESRGLLRRTHGGAILQAASNGNSVKSISSLHVRAQENQAEKDAIGGIAASLIDDGDTIMIDGGSTTQSVAKHLVGKHNLTIITNSISLLPDLFAIPDAVIYVVGGMVYRENEVLVGDISNENTGYFHPSKAVLGIDGVSPEFGLTAANTSVPAVAAIKKKMIASSHRLIIVADHTKLGRVCLMPVAPIDKMDFLVTDSGAPPEIVEAIHARGPVVKIATM
ncbi:MAG: DeoR/GlpR family DNA-binding transcription regulator [Chloroflexi bacterium]|nr:DeoR/GlpR family DNA-binding transcription regulator [Chloroflexota bacterium]